jgi:hypothetical protein
VSAGKSIAVRGEASGVPGNGSTPSADGGVARRVRPWANTGTAITAATARTNTGIDSFLIS